MPNRTRFYSSLSEAGLLAVALLFGATSQAAADFVGVHGAPAGSGWYVEHGKKWIEKNVSGFEMDLWVVAGDIDNSQDPNLACTPAATGDETCGFAVNLAAVDDIQLVSFLPSGANIKYKLDATAGTLQVNGVDTNHLPFDPTKRPLMHLGKLTVDTFGDTAPGYLETTGGEHVKADLTLNYIPAGQKIGSVADVVPEPSSVIMLMAGILGLVLFYGRRERKRRS